MYTKSNSILISKGNYSNGLEDGYVMFSIFPLHLTPEEIIVQHLSEGYMSNMEEFISEEDALKEFMLAIDTMVSTLYQRSRVTHLKVGTHESLVIQIPEGQNVEITDIVDFVKDWVKVRPKNLHTSRK